MIPVVFRLGVSYCCAQVVVYLASLIATEAFIWKRPGRCRLAQCRVRILWKAVKDLFCPIFNPLFLLFGEQLFSPLTLFDHVVCAVCVHISLLKFGCKNPGAMKAA
ncbi:hypothetical protein [Klebsiella phage 2b LV-2017]|nr:hypothetical protein [Klebsiella phage 2b LV-2017]